jgi:hypothetical protein
MSERQVCRGCGCTDDDGCLVDIGSWFGQPWQVGCHWAEVDDERGWLCSGCAEPARRVRGPVVDHRAPGAPARREVVGA